MEEGYNKQAGSKHIVKPLFPFEEPDPLCSLNLKETSDFVKSFPFSAGRKSSAAGVEPPRRSFPSKWDDAQKWLVASPAHPLHRPLPPPSPKNLCCDDKIIACCSPSNQNLPHLPNAFAGLSVSPNSLLKDKFTNEVVETVTPKFKNSEPSSNKQGFLFRNSIGISTDQIMQDAKASGELVVVEHRDVGTEMTPMGSSTTSRCHTPFKSSSPARHNTPANRSGPLAPISNSASSNNSSSNSTTIFELQDCHLAKLQFDPVGSIWSTREEEEEEVSKSLRHFETGRSSSVSDGRAAAAAALAWEEEEKNKWCLRYESEEARIQAWVNLQSAKAEAKSRQLEVKIQKMRANMEEKLMKRMAVVRRRAEDWRAAALQQHTQHINFTTEQARRMITTAATNTPPARAAIASNNSGKFVSSYAVPTSSCGCFPCNKLP
ncbi:unnamed protein product [Linum tenue]|uniref:Remorin C-terminal domain-containing protein n=1 Tax=Linum tenue TaxID=586396 RepID=A0AAV0KCZ7_9ROSI|nr:unnamed protein product [Linum tenue]